MEMTRAQVVAMMRRVGLHAQIKRAEEVLPEQVDTDRDAELLASLGISRERLVELLGSSP
jgi:hypothetical protein